MRSAFIMLIILGLSPAYASDDNRSSQPAAGLTNDGFKTASITRDVGPAMKPVLVLKKTNRLPALVAEQAPALNFETVPQ